SRLRCPEKWQRFGRSCYYLPNVTSTSVEANHTCHLQYSNARLMYIRHPTELFYAVHVAKVNRLNALLIEIDQYLIQDEKIANALSQDDRIQWLKFEKRIHDAHLKYREVKSSSSSDHDDLENVDEILSICHQVQWNVINNTTQVFEISTYTISDQTICSLSNFVSTMTYSPLCQYSLDFCSGNFLCGNHGQCVNILTGFKCSCSLFYDGQLCDAWTSIIIVLDSSKGIQIVIGIAVIVIIYLLTSSSKIKSIWHVIKWLIDYFKRKPKSLERQSTGEKYGDEPNETKAKNPEETSLIPPMRPFFITNRYATAAITGIQTMEILDILQEILIDINEPSDSGVFFDIGKRILTVLLIGFRYYPILACLQVHHIFVCCSSWIYVMGYMAHMIWREYSCMTYLPFSKKLSSLDQAYNHMDLYGWTLLYGFGKHVLYCLFLGYVGATLTVCLANSICTACKMSVPTDIQIDEFSFPQPNNEEDRTQNSQDKTSGEPGCGSSISKSTRKTVRGIDDFRFITIVVCAYTEAFIILFYLTCTTIFLYTMQKTSYIAILKYIFEFMLNMEVKEWSFQYEVVISGLITMVIFGIQLLISIIYYRKDIRRSYKLAKNGSLDSQLERPDIVSKGSQYRGFIARYLIVGYIVCFHLIFFIFTILRVILTGIGSLEWAYGIILPVLVLYGLQKAIVIIIDKMSDSDHVQDRVRRRAKVPHPILAYFSNLFSTFIGIPSSISGLLGDALINIILLPRINFSNVKRFFHMQDQRSESYEAFLLWEILYVHPIGFELLPGVVEMVTDHNITIREHHPEQVSGNDSQATRENLDGISYSSDDLSQERQPAHDSDSEERSIDGDICGSVISLDENIPMVKDGNKSSGKQKLSKTYTSV
ncbi:unnamed protein product, partial [Rotaria magnacalcarata]